MSSCSSPDAADVNDTKTTISTLDYKNTGKMGDTDGPAFAVYSKTGYTGASATLDIDYAKEYLYSQSTKHRIHKYEDTKVNVYV